MRVFITWSGDTSKKVAEALDEFLPSVIQAVKPFLSCADLKAGVQWSPELASELEKTKVGVICLTPDNLEKPWVMFEAGALSKTVPDRNTFVCPYLSRVEPGTLQGPLEQFQSVKADREGTLKLVQTVNNAQGDDQALSESQLTKAFEVYWPAMGDALNHVPQAGEPAPRRPVRDIVEEILRLLQNQERRRSFEAEFLAAQSARGTTFRFPSAATPNIAEIMQHATEALKRAQSETALADKPTPKPEKEK